VRRRAGSERERRRAGSKRKQASACAPPSRRQAQPRIAHGARALARPLTFPLAGCSLSRNAPRAGLIAQLFGVYDVLLLVALMSVNATMNLFGLLHEVMNEGREPQRVDW
jgi:hypothetical protein